jgi:polysaccharide biosynthesis/export protein
MNKAMKSFISKKIPGALFLLAGACLAVFLVAGCQTSSSSYEKDLQARESLMKDGIKKESDGSASLTLREGDLVKVTFPGAPNLDSAQQIRRDGKITLQLIGEMMAAGMTPSELEKEILKLCGSQLVSKEVMVTVDASLFPVFVTGAVIHPGKVMTDRPITALQAIMQAGGFNYTTANLKSVRVIREENGRVKSFNVNLKSTLQGKNSDPFDLKPADIVYVPEKFSWF